jgi:ribonuclease R
VHRALKYALTGAVPTNTCMRRARWRHCRCSAPSASAADEAEREVDERYRAHGWKTRRRQFDGVISGVTGFGLFVELDESKVNGLVHVTQLPHDYYHFDPIRKTLTGERRGSEFRLGKVRILVLKASMEERKIDFRLVERREDGEAVPPPHGQPAKRRKKKY